jgi:hypothetical protein
MLIRLGQERPPKKGDRPMDRETTHELMLIAIYVTAVPLVAGLATFLIR